MIEKQYEKVNVCKLQDELIAAGLLAGSFTTFEVGEDVAQIQFPDDVDLELVESVVEKHDKTPLPPPKTDLELAQETINYLGTQLFETQTQLFETQVQSMQIEQDKNSLGSQLFDLQTQLMMKGVI
ncbi:hypothetical protein [Clostridium magnum]|uniref:Uncharacterized protein n=1 Tax=Clostridium magnum DSM 2767 TaxID=1121326 RepID=A0A168E239_9CLOT|nr:hypothetical protein [Clostridium magnum]KZL93571.1 hypothetical protein CLMAG_06170 [Clostridium magnum DSM 2767]SHI59897.1 hypothetical protein SAMN02745944_04559 [Clostridium magnum DSM 2767]